MEQIPAGSLNGVRRHFSHNYCEFVSTVTESNLISPLWPVIMLITKK